jgi:O-antigen ligase
VITIPYAHNLVLDLWLRLGLIGLALFALALGYSVQGGLRVWRRDPDRVTASLALVLLGLVAGLVATGLLEPLLDEYRFATLFGVCLGLLRACVTSMNERPRLPRGPLAITASRFATGGPR